MIKSTDKMLITFETLQQELESWFAELSASVPAPKRVEANSGYCFRFEEESLEQAIIQKLVRILSGLNAIYILNEQGYFQEQATLQRTIDEFVEDVEFLSLALICGETTDLHKRFLDAFYLETLDTHWDKSKKTKGRNLPPRDKIRAYLAAATQSIFDRNAAVNASSAVSHGYSGYVHGFSTHVMDMYDDRSRSFLIRGMNDFPLRHDHIRDLRNYVLRTVYAITFAAKAMQRDSVFQQAFNRFQILEAAIESDVTT